MITPWKRTRFNDDDDDDDADDDGDGDEKNNIYFIYNNLTAHV